MSSKLSQPWIPVERIEELVQLEPALLILSLSVGAWILYKLFLRNVSPKRHRRLVELFKNLWFHTIIATVLFTGYYLLVRFEDGSPPATRALSYVGLFTLLSGSIVFVKVARILMFEYLFLSHMRVGVPLLLVNLFTLLLSVVLGGWIATEVFAIRLVPILATSAIFSLVLGLALQDTLGNLFAGIALQFDKPCEIGDWIEIQNGTQKWIGQVHEVSWRATVLIGMADELITVPNRVMGQAQIANFSLKDKKPIIRSQTFRIPFGYDPERVRTVLMAAARQCIRIRQDVSPIVYIQETTESWITFKLAYFIDSYGSQYTIGDEVIRSVLAHLDEAGIPLASSRLELQGTQVHRAPCNESAS